MNIVTISTLFPNCNDPKHGIFIQTRLRHLIQDFPDVNARVIAPVPWFPFSNKRFGEYAKYANVPYREIIAGVEVFHPKYLVIPKIGMYLTPRFMAFSMLRCLKRLNKTNKIDLIDGHYFYPDGVAISSCAQKLDIPFTCTARGTDINLVPKYPKALKMLKKVFSKAANMMTVCQALKDEMITLGVKPERIDVLRNGVDLTIFSASNNEEQCQLKLNKKIDGPLLLSVGWLIERKGHHLIIEALTNIPSATLVIAGDGPDLTKLMQLAQKYKVEDRVQFIGAVNQKCLNEWMQAADMLILASSREGWANVLLESMASGTPVVATKVWGTPEIVQNDDVGVLVERTVNDITAGINNLITRISNNQLDRKLVRQFAEQFDWHTISAAQHRIFKAILKK